MNKATSKASLSAMVLLCIATGAAQAQVKYAPKQRDGSQQKPIQLSPKEVQDQQISIEQLRQELLHAKPARLGPRVANPNTARARNTMIALLRQQQQDAVTERATIFAARRNVLLSKDTQGLGPAPQAKNKVAASPSATRDLKRTTILDPGQNSSAAHPQYSQLNPAACAQPEIYTVNGHNQGVVFTPDTQYNLYTIKGCKFGEQQGEVHLFAHFKSAMIRLVVEFWNDNSIVAAVDPGVSGELDQDNVTLVVKTASAGQIQKAGFRFYAVRETVFLNSIPVPDSPFWNGPPRGPWESSQYMSPLTDSSGATARVTRSSDYRYLPRGEDHYRVQGLAPGFVADSVQVAWSGMTQPQCAESITAGQLVLFGTLDVFWTDRGFAAEYPAHQCNNFNSLYPPKQIDVANYWVTVWVTGPKGVSPR